MLHAPAFLLYDIASKFARQRRARQRQRLMRLTLVYNPAQQTARTRFQASFPEAEKAQAGTGTVVRIGGYVVGDEHCPLLYGPTNMRY
ncbi:hypothetical protein [Hymenobacter aerophilus]|uniref:hypothetical protein n=1 Tax=Hymenobacter aerophilus TaxID=119644 RepID=UPI00035E0643|nr:hypothetical protein [Hymenobacter aerophilus]